VCAGLIDSFPETLKALKEMGDLPLSIQMIRVRNTQIEDTNDPATLLTECEMMFAECERTYFEMMSL
jgi:hypothetical protein